MKKGFYCAMTALLFHGALFADIGDGESAEKISQQDKQWQKAIDDFAKSDANSVTTPYMQAISQLNSYPDHTWCTNDVLSLVNHAISLNASSLVAYSMLFTCAAKRHKNGLKQKYKETIDGLIKHLVDGKAANSIATVIDIRELMEAPLLLQAMGYNILDMNMVTRFGGIYYQYHVIDPLTSTVTTRYFSNLQFMKKRLSNPNVSDDVAAQLLSQYYEQQKLDFAITAKARRLVAQKKYTEAITVLNTIEDYSMTSNVMQARIYLATGQTELLKALKRLLNLDAMSGFIPAAIVLAQITISEKVDNEAEQISSVLEGIDNYTQPGEGAFRLSLALQKVPSQAKDSLKWLTQAVAAKHPQATLALAKIYRQGTLGVVDDKKALELFEQAQGYGIDQASIELARYYHVGSSAVKANHSKELVILRKLADKKHATAAYLLGQRYQNGIDVDTDFQQAYQWYQLAFDNGARKAANQIGILAETGQVGSTNGEPNYDLAYQWYQQASLRGDSNGFSNLARFHHYGVGRNVNLRAAANQYVKAAETGSQVAYCKLADVMLEMESRTDVKWQGTLARIKALYEYGVKQEGKLCPRRFGRFYQMEMNDPKRAQHWYEIAVNNGDKPALIRLETLYFVSFAEKDYPTAFANFTKGAAQSMAKSTYYLGKLYHKGLGVQRDDNKALELWKKAQTLGYAAAGNAITMLYFQGQDSVKDRQKAQQRLDKIANLSLQNTLEVAAWFFYGRDFDINYEQALVYFERAAEQDSGTAINHLGEMYRFGWGVEIDYAKAMQWYIKGVEINHVLSVHNIAEMYYQGTGAAKNNMVAFDWFKRGAALNISHSQFFLGQMYQKGEGVPKDLTKANHWYYTAMDLNHQGAKFVLGKNMIEGLGMARSPDKGLLFVTEAAEGGYQPAIDYLKLEK
jgi:TPR repeat protein